MGIKDREISLKQVYFITKEYVEMRKKAIK